MKFQHTAWALCLSVAACGGDQQPQRQVQMDEAKAIASEVAEAAARECPWPAALDHFEETAPAGPDRSVPPPTSGAFGDSARGCAVLTFSVSDAGVAGDVQLVDENPPGFGKFATRVLRSYDYATGANSLTNFVVRMGVRALPSGGTLLQMTFKDRIINVILPR